MKRSLNFYIKNPKKAISGIIRKLYFIFPDEIYLKIIFLFDVGYPLNLKRPKTYNEKLQWLKLHDKNPLHTKLVDKISVKDYVSSRIGDQYIIPTLGIWNHFSDIDFSKLPNQFVLKTNNGGGGGGVMICKNKLGFDREIAKIKLERNMKSNVYYKYKEWPYKNIKSKLFAEKYLEDESGELRDYKVLVFGGVAKLIEYHAHRFSDKHLQLFFDINWKPSKVSQDNTYKTQLPNIPPPICLKEMIHLSESLAKDMAHCRVDWYIVDGKLYFGELTFFDGSGLVPFDKKEYDTLLGSWIDLNFAYDYKKDRSTI